MRVFGNDERGVLAFAVGGVALGDAVGLALGRAAARADFLAGVYVEFVGGVREDDGADVPAFHDEAAAGGEAAQQTGDDAAHRGPCGDAGDAGIHAAVARMARRVGTVDVEHGLRAVFAAFEVKFFHERGDGGLVIRGDAGIEHGPGDGAVKAAAVDITATEFARELARDAAFS